jgi:hypothetical protein
MAPYVSFRRDNFVQTQGMRDWPSKIGRASTCGSATADSFFMEAPAGRLVPAQVFAAQKLLF